MNKFTNYRTAYCTPLSGDHDGDLLFSSTTAVSANSQ